jgi:hypothetical protein
MLENNTQPPSPESHGEPNANHCRKQQQRTNELEGLTVRNRNRPKENQPWHASYADDRILVPEPRVGLHHDLRLSGAPHQQTKDPSGD